MEIASAALFGAASDEDGLGEQPPEHLATADRVDAWLLVNRY